MAASDTSDTRHIRRSQALKLLMYAGADSSEERTISSLLCSLAGFVADDVSAGIYRCAACGLKVKGLHPSHSPLAWHRTLSPRCTFLHQNSRYNVADLGIPFPTVPGVDSAAGSLDQGTSTDMGQPNLTLQQNPLLTSENRVDAANSMGQSLTQQYLRNSDLRIGRWILCKQVTTVIFYWSTPQPKVQGFIIPRDHIEDIRQCQPSQAGIPELSFEANRRKTFISWPAGDLVSAKELARSGFVYTGNADTVECVYCKVRLRNWTNEQLPHHRHIDQSPACQFVQGQTTVINVPDVISDVFEVANSSGSVPDISGGLGIITDVTKHPEMAVSTRREDTLLTWPRNNKKMAAELIEHQLYYTGQGDTVCCFSCGVEMSKWSAVEDIWLRHARQSPNCQLLIREKGQDFVTSTIAEHGRYVEPAEEPTINVVTTRMLRPRFDSPVAQAVLDMVDPGYRREDIRAALILNIKYGRPDFQYTKDLVAAILERTESQNELGRIRLEIEEEIPAPQVIEPPHETQLEEMGSENIEDLHVMGEEGGQANTETGLTEETASGDLEARVSAADPADIPAVGRELKNQFLCKICLQQPIGIIFLPCGHLVCCNTCAPAMVVCPICRQEVRGTIQAQFNRL